MPRARSSSLITAVAVFRMNVRLFRTTETALADLRVRAFRHVHDLSVLHQQGERRGSLVSRVTSDVDQLSVFMQWGGVLGLVSVGQLVVATVVMAFYSWQLTLLVLACFIPLGIAVRCVRRSASPTSTASSASGSATCWPPSPSPSSARRRCAPTASAPGRRPASTPPSTGTTARAGRRAEGDRGGVRQRRVRRPRWPTRRWSSSASCSGVGGHISAGTLVAFLFLVTLFVAPVQTASEVLNEAQNAVAGFRRVLDVIDTEPDIRDPALDGPGRAQLPAGPAGRAVRARRLRATPRARRPALRRRRPQPSRRAAGSRSSARPARARRRSPSCSPG